MGKELISKTAKEKIKSWLVAPYDEETRNEIKEMMKNHPEAASEAFSTELKFGTGGMRAKMGPGPGRINKYTIQIATQGLANYILTFPQESYKNGVVICHDPRIHARDFAIETARVLAGNGIIAHLVPELRPTPFASFCVRHFQAIAGINITASHNPKEYNGYKVYWEDGAQVVPPHDTKIIEHIEKISSPNEVHLSEENDPLIQLIPKEVDKAYLDAILDLRIDKHLCMTKGKDLSIIYSPLNGAGITMIPEALRMWGFENVEVVEEQKTPDGNFPTTPYPNPETDAALELGWRDMIMHKADILLVSDPDSDRLSCSIPHNKKSLRLSGNELGALMLHYLLHKKSPKGRFATVTTIVSSGIIREMTERHNGTCFEVLTGFKYIGEKIHQWEGDKLGYTFLFGMEESLGYLYGTHSRDKDATIAACLTAELCVYLKGQGKTLIDQLYSIYATYGIHREAQRVIESKEGLDALIKKMQHLRDDPPKELCGVKVLRIEDYQLGKALDIDDEKESSLDLPQSNVLIYFLEDKSKFIFRPSGTEPKLKIYGQCREDNPEVNDSTVRGMDKKVEDMLKQLDEQYFS